MSISILETQQNILEYLLNNDSIKYEQFAQFFEKGIDMDIGITSVLGALRQLERADIVFGHQTNQDDIKTLVFVKSRPLELNMQSINIGGNLACAIANVVNNFSDTVNAPELKSNPLSIKENDLLILLDIIQFLSNDGEDNPAVNKQELKKEIRKQR